MSQENGIVVTLTGTETGNAMKHGLLMKEVPANHWPYVHDDPDGSVNLIWPLLIFSFGSTPSGESTPAPRRSEALRRP